MSGNNETTIGNTPRFPDGGPTWHEALKIRNNGVFFCQIYGKLTTFARRYQNNRRMILRCNYEV